MKKKPKPNSIFSEDAVIRTLNHVTINKEHIPISGVTKESELTKIFPEGYNRRLSYVYPREKIFEKKKIVFNRIYFYVDVINRPIKGEGISYGHVGLERKYLTIFVLDGIVQDHTLIHSIKNSKDGWVRGPMNELAEGRYENDWPDASLDLYDYYTQPGDHMRADKPDLEDIMSFYDTHKPPVKTRILYPKGEEPKVEK